MKYSTKILLALLCLQLATKAQDTFVGDGKGIKWTTGLSWEQVKAKAKQENKYIFLDCYATWCGPCKMMDNSTYMNDSVGNYFNDKFISVKVQMDKTAKDDDGTRSWYSDADSISKRYHIEGYPCFIFFTPQGEIVHKAMGFKPVADFIADGKLAILPGKIYTDAYAKYDAFVIAYKDGERNYDVYPSMIMTASLANDSAMQYQLLRELSRYMADLPVRQRYTKERIEIWTSYGIPNFTSKGRVFQFFYKDGKIIDKVMRHKGYAAEVVDRTIQNEICIPFMESESKGIAMTGMYLNGPGLKPDESEADWQKLDSIIRQKYGATYANRAVLTARIEWYSRHRNYSSFVEYSLKQLKKYPPDFSKGSTEVNINGIGWDAFLHLTDKILLNACIPWMKKVIEQWPKDWQSIDTYANLLYKTGKIQEAIRWEQKAVSLNPEDKRLRTALENMQQGKPTFIGLGAVWEGINTVSWEGVRYDKLIMVIDSNKKRIKGASAVNKRTGESKLSNEYGAVVLNVALDDKIIISYSDYVTQEISITKDPEPITLVLKQL